LLVIIILIPLFGDKIMFKKMRKIVKKMRKIKYMKKEETWKEDEKAEIAEMMMDDMMMDDMMGNRKPRLL